MTTKSSRRIITTSIASLGLSVALAKPAQAEETAKNDKPYILQARATPPSENQISLLALIGPSYGGTNVGVTGVYGIAWFTTGVLNDALYVEFGGQLNHVFSDYWNWTVLSALVGLRYEVEIVPKFSLYSAARSGPSIGLSDARGFGWIFTSHFGGHYDLSEQLSIRAEVMGGNLGYNGVSAGMTYMF